MFVVTVVLVGLLLVLMGWAMLTDGRTPMEEKPWGALFLAVGVILIAGGSGYAVI